MECLGLCFLEKPTPPGATALFRTLRTLGPAATALLLGLVLLAAVTLAAFGGTARWSASAPVLLTDVLDPGPLQYWHCSKEAGHGGRRSVDMVTLLWNRGRLAQLNHGFVLLVLVVDSRWCQGA